MGLEGGGESSMLGLGLSLRHRRSRSLSDKRVLVEDNQGNPLESSVHVKPVTVYLKEWAYNRKKQSSTNRVQCSLKQEILQLEGRLQDQFKIRNVLEKALGNRSSSLGNLNDPVTPKPATELIKEIAVLEVEVVYLEQHLLSLYRKAFDEQLSSASQSNDKERVKPPVMTPRAGHVEVPKPDNSRSAYEAVQSCCQELDTPEKEPNGCGIEEKQLDSGVPRCQSSLSQCTAYARTSLEAGPSARALRACHSQPLSMMEYAQNALSTVVSLAEHLGTRVSDHVPDTPNKISEDMVKCLSAIYSKLAEPPSTHHGLLSPSSSVSSMGAFSPRDQGGMWSPGFRNNSSFDVRLDNPFHVEGLKEFSGPYSTMLEVLWIYRDNQSLGDIQDPLQNLRSLICRLEEVDPGKLKHEEKLSFWINIHNALVMHAYLTYGIPQNNVKKVFLLLKAAYNVGGHMVSADTIQNIILGCHTSRPGQWLRILLSPLTKFKTGDGRQAFTVKKTEPLLHFALCSGNHSDPAVRIYTPKRVYQELESAKEEYIRATLGVRKDRKILLPKVVESFAKESGLCPAGLMEMVQLCLPETLRKSVKKCLQGKSRKAIEWIPHNFTFRYLISKEVVK